MTSIESKVHALYETGGFIEVFGGLESGKTTFVKQLLLQNKHRTVVLGNDIHEYTNIDECLAVPTTSPSVAIPALRELLFTRTVRNVVFDQLGSINEAGESVHQFLTTHFQTLLLPVFQAKAVVYIVNSDTFIENAAKTSKILSSHGAKYLRTITDMCVYKANKLVPPILI